MIKRKNRWRKGEMSRTIVIYCIRVMTVVLIWAMVMASLSAIFGWSIDISSVTTYAAAAFGGELTVLAFKRIFAKKREEDPE